MQKLEIPRHVWGNGPVLTVALSPGAEVFQVKLKVQRRLRNCKRRIRRRLRKKQWAEQRRRMFRDRNVHYERADRTRGLHAGGLGACQLLVQRLGLADAIDRDLHLLKRHVPYFESDHVLNLTYNLLAGGTCLEDLELLRNNENYLDVLGAQRIPDPTTAGDFLRRFAAADLDILSRVINQKRVQVWHRQPATFLEHVIIEPDYTPGGRSGGRKQSTG